MLIRLMEEKDRENVIQMMRNFYASPAVWSNGSEEIFTNDFNYCVSDSPYLEGYIFEDNGEILGYSMMAKSFSTEFGKPCMWIEDLYLKEKFRGCGIGSAFFDFIHKKYVDVLFRLEVETENENAFNVYVKKGYDVLPYVEMKK